MQPWKFIRESIYGWIFLKSANDSRFNAVATVLDLDIRSIIVYILFFNKVTKLSDYLLYSLVGDALTRTILKALLAYDACCFRTWNLNNFIAAVAVEVLASYCNRIFNILVAKATLHKLIHNI